jgi:hypothetical protein
VAYIAYNNASVTVKDRDSIYNTCSSQITQDDRCSIANSLGLYPLQTLKQFFLFQNVKLNSTCYEETHFVTDIRGEEHLGEQSAELSELKKEERFDSCEIYTNFFSRNNKNNSSGLWIASNRETLSRCGTCVTSLTLKRKAMEGFRGLELRFSCDLCKKHFTYRNHLDIHTRVHTGERPFFVRNI